MAACGGAGSGAEGNSDAGLDGTDSAPSALDASGTRPDASGDVGPIDGASDTSVPPADASGPDAGGDGGSDASGDAGGDGGSDGATGLDASGDASSDASRDAADAATNDDPFDPASCAGPALDSAQALALLGAAPRVKLADATLMRRTRTCTGAAASTCGAWGAPVAHQQSLLTYSGGVVTDYKTFAFPTHLVLFAQAGVPQLSIRHTSDYQHAAAANTRGVVFPFGATPMVNTYPVIYVWDFAPAPNRYDDLQGLLGNRAELSASARCARLLVTNGVGMEIAALYRY